MFQAIAIQGGFVVAYRRPDGKLTAYTEHATRETAEREADQRNAQQLAQQQAQRLRDIAQQATQRRPVRWFEPDAYA